MKPPPSILHEFAKKNEPPKLLKMSHLRSFLEDFWQIFTPGTPKKKKNSRQASSDHLEISPVDRSHDTSCHWALYPGREKLEFGEIPKFWADTFPQKPPHLLAFSYHPIVTHFLIGKRNPNPQYLHGKSRYHHCHLVADTPFVATLATLPNNNTATIQAWHLWLQTSRQVYLGLTNTMALN